MSPTSSTTRSKRHSLVPKPLQLINVPPPSSPVILTTPVHHPSSPIQNKPRTHRRQSSISYKRSSYDSLTQSRRANEVDPAPQPENELLVEKLRPKSAVYPSAPLLSPLAVEDRPPFTLAEKHADLLQFIAQKESKCLELRSQLAVHEAELLQLKRTWERIVSRSFESPHSTLPTPATTPSPPTIHTPYPSNVVLEGIKEGVQGMSRLIASGLSTSNAEHPNPPSTHPHSTFSESRPISRKPRPHSLYFPLSPSSPSSHFRSSNLSTSSTCTTATSATRFSAASPSSASTFFEEPESWADDAEQKQKAIEHGDDHLGRDAPESRTESPDLFSYQELMVRDTGATPTVLPNPRFKFGIDRRKERESQRRRNEREDDIAGDGDGNNNDSNNNTAGVSIPDGQCLSKDEQRQGTLRTLTANSSAVRIDAGNTRCHRRKSRETSASYGCYLRPGDEGNDHDVDGLSPARFSPGSRSAIPGPPSTEAPSATTSTLPSLVPPAQNHAYSSWTKRWTLGKSQKRASALLSDVSQTLFSTFSLAGTGSLVGSSSGASSSLASSASSGAKQASMSLLDDDMEVFSATSAVLQPMKPVLVVGGGACGKAPGPNASTTNEVDDDDGEWNW